MHQEIVTTQDLTLARVTLASLDATMSGEQVDANRYTQVCFNL